MKKYCRSGGVEDGVVNQALESARAGYRYFLNRCEDSPGMYRLTPYAEVTPYGLCFALFGLRLLLDEKVLSAEREVFITALRDNVRRMRRQFIEPPTDKGYRQLLTFTLSALALLDALEDDPLEELVIEQLAENMAVCLEQAGALEGLPQSGNQAMFLAIFLLHARDYLGRQVDGFLSQWVDLHLNSMNRFGFWGRSREMTHLQFQNGYHQYEILEYLGIENPRIRVAVDAVRFLADPEGHFAPCPGGGGCYDYDAVYILTSAGSKAVTRHRDLLMHTAQTILTEQNPDGGFCESLHVRPRTFDNLARSVRHIFSAHGAARVERLRQSITLLRPKHNRIHTHWSEYSRRWNESDLWDSWFRMLTVARIDVALDPARISEWGFIDYPGIGFHSLLRHK